MSSPPLAGEPNGKYGPRTAVVEKIIDRAGRLTAQEVRALDAAWGATYDWDAWDAAIDAAIDATYDWDAWYAAWARAAADGSAAAWADARDATGDAGSAAESAALAALVTDLAGEYGLTREHLETLVEPWRQVITDVDPLAEMESEDDG